MKAKRWLAVLLALVLCLQLLPTVAFAATAYSIEVPESVEGGTATITTTDTTLTVANGKVSGITANTQLVTITATPEAGYKFTGWKPYRLNGANWSEITNAAMLSRMITYGSKTDGTKYTLSDSPMVLSIGAMKANLKLVPVFAKALVLTLESADSEKGSLSGATKFFPGGEAVTLTAAPAEGCTFTGCTLAYTEGGAVVPAADYTMKLDGNTVTLSLGANVTKAVTVTGHFVDADEPNFVIPSKGLKVISGGTATVTGWNNNPEDKITVTLNTVNTTTGIQFFLKEYNQTDKTYSQLVPTNVTFDFSETASITPTDNGGVTLALKGEGISTLLEIPFTVSDGRNHTKEGVIRMELANRAIVSSGKGTVMYDGKEYKDGEWIDFTGTEATIEAVGYDESNMFGVLTFYRLSDWSITGVTLGENNKSNLLTFKLPGKFFEIKPNFVKSKSLSIQPAENGSASFEGGETTVYQAVRGTEFAAATATPNAGYAFSKWKLEYESIKNVSGTAVVLWKELDFGAFAGSGLYDVGEGNTKYSNPLQIKLVTQSMRLTPLFVDKIDVTAASSDTTRGNVTASATELPVGGDGITLTVTTEQGCSFKRWAVTYTETGSVVPDDAYTLTDNGDGTWKLVNLAVGQPMTVTASFSSEKDPNFTVEDKLPAFISTQDDLSSTASVTGWTDDTEEEITVTFTQIYSSSKIYLKKDGVELTPANLAVDIQNPSETTITRTVTDSDIYYDLGDITGRTEIPFTVSDGRGNSKTGVIRLEVAGHAQVSVVSGKETGTIMHNGTTYTDGDMLIFTPAEGKVTVKAVPAQGYKFAGWEIDGVTLEDATAAEIRFDTPAQFVTLKATFEKYELRFKMMLDGGDISGASFTYGTPYTIYMFTDDMDIDTAIQNRANLTKTHTTPVKIASGVHVLLCISAYPDIGNYVFTGINCPQVSSMQERTVSSSNSYYNEKRFYLFTMPDGDVDITLNIKTAALFEISAGPEQEGTGSVEITPASDTGIYREGVPLMMSAIPAEGYIFKEWKETGGTHLSAEQKTTATVQFSVGSTSTFAAVFERVDENKPLPLTLKVVPEGKATILVNGSKDITEAAYGSKLTVSLSDIDEYYLFDHWEITQNTTNEGGLIREIDKSNAEISFVMPNDSEGVTIQAVLKERTIPVSFVYSIDGAWSSRWPEYMTFDVTVNDEKVTGSTTVKKGDVLDVTVKIADEYKEDYVLKTLRFNYPTEAANTFALLKEYTDIHGTYKIEDWLRGIQVSAELTKKTEATTRNDVTLTQPETGGTIQSSNQTAMAGTEVTLTAVPADGYVLKAWTVTSGGEAVEVNPTNDEQATFTMPAADVAVTAEFEKIKLEITSVELLQGKGGDVLAKGVPSGDKWTITIPNTVSAETVAKIPEGLSGLYLKIVTPAGVKVQQGDGQFNDDWSAGDIICYMPVNEEVVFHATAGTATKDYTIELVYIDPNTPALEKVSVTRTSDTAATVKFTSSLAGNYFYKVVNKGATAPTVDAIVESSTNGTAKAGENTITLTNLTAGARDIYIVVVSASGVKSMALKVEIPAYGSDVPDTGAYTISVSTPKGGTITTNRTKANEGEEIIVTVIPDSGYQMVEGSLCYGFAKGGAPMDKVITNNRFKMPAGDINITCQWETATTTAKGITSFSINGVAGAVNNTTNTITITMPRGTDVTKLTPTISTNGVKSLTPGSGETVNFTNSVNYTATMEDGSTKTYTVTVYVEKGTLADQFWDKLTDFVNQVPWWEYAKHQQSSSSYPKYW